MTIVLVDDSETNLFVISTILKSDGYTDFVTFTSAKDMFTYLETNAQHVDVILLDVMMPHMDGIEACRLLKQNETLKDIQVIFVTALEDKTKLSEALDVGGIDYIVKPINKVDLLARLRVAQRLKAELDWHRQHEQTIQRELHLASLVQQSLLSPPLKNDQLSITASYVPSFNLAGDLYYWIALDDNRYGVILLDMMGHGVSASLVCMYISSVMRESIKLLTRPELVIAELNRYMNMLHHEQEDLSYYFTAVYFVIDVEKKRIDYVNAGHPTCYALLDEETVEPLTQTACAVGFFETMDIEMKTLRFQNSAQILLFTDGVLEAMDEDEFEAERKIQKYMTRRWHSIDRPLHLLVPSNNHDGQPDDMCVVLLQAGFPE